MPKVAITSLIASSLILGRKGGLRNSVQLAPRETKTLDVSDVQLRTLTPELTKLKDAGWVNYAVTDGAAAPAPVVAVVPPPAPVVVVAPPVVEIAPPPAVVEVAPPPAVEAVEPVEAVEAPPAEPSERKKKR